MLPSISQWVVGCWGEAEVEGGAAAAVAAGYDFATASKSARHVQNTKIKACYARRHLCLDLCSVMVRLAVLDFPIALAENAGCCVD
jgi:hypothetical protein